MSDVQDGPVSTQFIPLALRGNVTLAELADVGISAEMAAALECAPTDLCVGWGIPFEIGNTVVLTDQAVSIDLPPTTGPWLIFMHTSDLQPNEPGAGSFISPRRGEGQLGEHAANYVMLYADGTEERVAIRRCFQLGADGTLTGSAGCNSYSAGYDVDGNNITIGLPISTLMACGEPEGIMEQEQEYLTALGTAATYQIDGDRMEMRTAEGSIVATFERAVTP